MRLKKRYIVLITAGAVLLMLAVDFMGIKAGYVFLAAGAAVILVSISSGWANGILSGLFFNFAFYSMHHEAALADIAVNTLVYAAFAVLSDRIRLKPLYEDAADKSSLEEKSFVDKITNSFIIAHDMLLEIKKGLTRPELFSLLARNVTNLSGCSHVLIYGPDKPGETNLSLKHSYGVYKDKEIEMRVADNDLSPLFLRNVQAGFLRLVQDISEGFMTVIPVKGEKGLSGAVVLYKKTGFSHNDIYIAEFFAAQVFIIIEKHDMLGQMSDNHENIIETLVMAIDIKDHDTHGHSFSTMKYALQIAQQMKLPPEECEKIKHAALLHDIGKIKISSEILKKPSTLTAEEYETVKKHPQDGVDILNGMDIFEDILPIILYHHEHFDGRGYPKKLIGDKIPLGSRICAVADAYSVMLAERPYRRARTKEEAATELKRCAGSQFDSHIVKVFLDSMENTPAEEGNKQSTKGLVN
jgi:putative nucleotidyltransferase with HDIG domain